MNETTEFEALCGWAKLFHPSGALITLPVGAGFDYAAARADVDAALAAGWLVAPPGLAAGEQKALCGWVVRSQKDGRTGTAEVLDLYLPDDMFSKVRVYLNTPEEVAAFEYASKMRVDKLPLYIGAGKIERGKDKRMDALVVKVPKPFGFVWQENPDYDEKKAEAAHAAGEIYSTPKRKWLRWAEQKPPEPDARLVTRDPATPADLVAAYQVVTDDAGFGALEDARKRLWDAADADEKRTMKAASDDARKRLIAGSHPQVKK